MKARFSTKCTSCDDFIEKGKEIAKNEDGDWVDSNSNKILKNKVEDAILTKARKFKIQNKD